MDGKGHKSVRFEDWRSESSLSSTEQNGPGSNEFRKGKVKLSPVTDGATKKMASRRKVLDPQGSFLQKWNKIFVLSCFLAISVDPLFLYIPVINEQDKCLDLSGKPLKIIACVLRTFFDIFYILRIIFQFRTGFIAPSSRVFGRGEFVDDPVAIVKRYLRSYFIIDILSIIPLPQMAILLAFPPKLQGSAPKKLLKYIIIAQYVPRLVRIYPLYKEVTSTSGILTETAWAGAAFNLLLYILASHVVGSFWYLFSVESEVRCWQGQLKKVKLSHECYLSCREDNQTVFNHTVSDKTVFNQTVFSLLNACTSWSSKDPDGTTNQTDFNYGIFLEALESRVVYSSKNFTDKIYYSFAWGLRSVSSVGQNFKTSTYSGEITFAIFISISGLVLFASLIGNMQKYIQSTTVRVEEMRIKRRDAEHWMSHRMLPDHLKERVRRYDQYKWQENRGVEEETLIRNLPKDLRRDIKRHLCLDLLIKVPMFENMDNKQLLDAMCDRLRPVLYTEKSAIVREGDPVDEMLFIMRGVLATATTNGGKTGFFNSSELKAGDFCGEELLTWALDPNTSQNLPISTRTVQTISEVEAFALTDEDLKFVASQFRRLINSIQLKHTFRFYSLQWRTWATCCIQAAWRRYLKKKAKRSLRASEDRLRAFAHADGSSPSIGAAMYASRFSSNLLRSLRNSKRNKIPHTHKVLPLLPQKPPEPDFTAKEK